MTTCESGSAVERLARIGMAISDPGRLRLVMAMEGRSLCVCELTELLGLAPSTVSKHLSILKQAGLVQERKCGRWVYHGLRGGDSLCGPVQDWIHQQLSADPQILLDHARLLRIVACHAEPCCR